MKKIILYAIIASNLLFTTLQAQNIIGTGPVRIVVSDMRRSLEFYTHTLPFKVKSEKEVYGDNYEKLENLFGLRMHIINLTLGNEEIELVDYLTPGGRSIPEDFKSNDLAFQHIAIVVSNMEKAFEELGKHPITYVSTDPQTLPASIPEAAGVKAFYFQDPDKHVLELIYFPKDKGQAKWHRTNPPLFMGIDHTAFGVSNTNQSLSFYRDLLGIERKGDSHNKGVEQSHLNNVEDASLHITGLRGKFGIGLEFLEYLYPGPGKTYPTNTRSDDIWNWETTLFTDNIDAFISKIRENKNLVLVSKAIVTVQEKGALAYKAFIIRDPDGHALFIREQ